MSKKQRIADLEGERDEGLDEIERLHREIEAGYVETASLRELAARGRLVILFAKAGGHLVPVYDEPVRDASVTVNSDFIDTTVFGEETKKYLVGPSTITIRVTK